MCYEIIISYGRLSLLGVRDDIDDGRLGKWIGRKLITVEIKNI
jgi:hypothetical protein